MPHLGLGRTLDLVSRYALDRLGAGLDQHVEDNKLTAYQINKTTNKLAASLLS